MTRRSLASWLAILVFLAAPQIAGAQSASSKPGSFINEFSQRGIADILAAEIPEEEKQQRFREMFKEYFDLPYIGRFVLGRYWRLTSDEQKESFGDLFEDVIVQTWSRRFSEYDGQTLNVISTVSDGDDGAIVKSQIVGDGGTNINVDWRLRQRQSGFQVVDVVVEGVSMAITYRQEYSTIISRSGGFDALLQEMRKQVGNPLA
ncbi:MAG: ABC transporter substrate-binding protein, partial [Rhodospirillaceae bacterium]